MRLHPAPLGESLPEALGKRCRALRLNGGESRRPLDQPPRPCFLERLPERRRVAEVAGGQHDPVRRLPAELLQQLEHDGFLALEPERIHRVQEIDPQPLARLVGELEAVVEVAADQQGAGSVRERLGELPQRDLTLRHQDQGRQPGERRIRGERRRRVSGRRACHGAGSHTPRLRHSDGHAAVLERPRGVLAFVLEQQLRRAGPARDRCAREQRRVALGV